MFNVEKSFFCKNAKFGAKSLLNFGHGVKKTWGEN